MKKLLFICIVSTFFTANLAAQTTITLYNSSAIDRSNEVVEIPWSLIAARYKNIDTNALVIRQKNQSENIVYQFEYHGQPTIQNLLVEVSIPAGKSITLQFSKGKKPVFDPKTYCRYVPERKDDFAWENDKIAYRMYGKALELTPKENAYGTDVWSKRTHKMIINDWYKSSNYHEDRGDGLDYYHVGFTLGAGEVAPYSNDSIWFPKNYTTWKVLDNGPLRSSFIVYYDAWNVNGQMVTMSKTISIDAGSQLSKVKVDMEYHNANNNLLVMGISKRALAGALLMNEQKGILGYWEPTIEKNGTIGVGCIITHTNNKMLLQKGHLLNIVSYKADTPFIYYKGAAWDKAGEITSAETWFNYLSSFENKLNNPILIK